MTKFPEKLLQGFKSFTEHRHKIERERYTQLANYGQAPETMVIGCCDSRAAPETIFDSGPGEMFVLRNVANLVPPFEPDGGQHGTSAAIEFAVKSLEVKNLIVLGHGRCGGIHAALHPTAEPLAQGDFIGKWMKLLEPVTEQFCDHNLLTDGERATMLERISIRNSIKNLRTFPYITELEREGKLAVHGAWFDIKTGELWVMDSECGEFERPDIWGTPAADKK